MPFIEEVSNYIAAQSTVFAVAPSSTSIPLWSGDIDDVSPATAVGIYESGGAAPQYQHANVVSYERPSIQVITRSTSYVTAKANADRIWDILSTVTGVDITKTDSTGVTNYITITPNQSPFEIGKDSLQRQRFSCNYFIQKERS
jgi:hypothetical protein